MSEDMKTDQKDEMEQLGTVPETKLLSRKRRTIVTLVAVALVALVLCVCGLSSGCSPTAISSGDAADDTTLSVPSEKETAAEEPHEHDWTVTYKTVHHDAVTHTETVEPDYADETSYHTVCNDCNQIIDGIADQHIRETGHSGYSTNVPITNEVLVSEGYAKEVVDTPAYDETVPDALVCTLCGETRPLDSAVE